MKRRHLEQIRELPRTFPLAIPRKAKLAAVVTSSPKPFATRAFRSVTEGWTTEFKPNVRIDPPRSIRRLPVGLT